MYIDLRKTLEEISRCLPKKGAPTPKQLRRMYELTLRLQSQELAVIYDMEAFGGPTAQEQRTLAQQHGGGESRNGIFFRDDDMEHMAFSVVGRWGEKGVTILRISDYKQIGADQRH